MFHIDLRNFLPNNLQPSSPAWLTSLLSTNDPPDSVTQDVLSSTLPVHIDNAHNLESKVSESRHLLNFLTEQLLAAKAHIQDIKTVTHPIRQVQDDVWREILLFTIAGSQTQSPSIYDTPWYLAQVCHQWRTVALHTARLWSYMRLNFATDRLLCNPDATECACSILTERLNRCMTIPRDVKIFAPYTNLQNNSVFRTFIMHTATWRSLDINTNSVNFISLKSRQSFFSCLQSLRIVDMEFSDDRGTHGRGYDRTMLDAFSIIPHINPLDVPDIPMTEQIVAPTTNRSIKRLGISLSNQYDAVMATLKSMTWLSSLEIMCNEIVPYGAQTIDLPSLRRLLLRDPVSCGHIPHLWSKIRVPSLKCFALCYEGDDIDQPIYPSLLSSHTPITDFRVYMETDVEDAQLFERAFIAILYNLPNLTTLELNSNTSWPLVVHELRVHTDLLPHLRTLHFLVETFLEGDSSDAFVQMLQDRKLSPTCMTISHLSLRKFPVMNHVTLQLWHSLLNDNAQPMEIVRVDDATFHGAHAFLDDEQ